MFALLMRNCLSSAHLIFDDALFGLGEYFTAPIVITHCFDTPVSQKYPISISKDN